MSTNDVPGNDPANRDELAMGCWAEHEDGSMIFVESTEGGRVIYSVFDMEKVPVIEYRDAMAEGAFKKQYSWTPKDGKSKDKWTWHDKTPFPWDKIIKAGGRDGLRHASADDTLNAAERIRNSRKLKGSDVDEDEIETKIENIRSPAGRSILRNIQKQLNRLTGGE